MNILFICTGNTCRSPMAEKILAKKAAEEGLVLNIKSAGVSALEGQTASKHATEIMQEYGDKSHNSQQVTADLVEWADLIFAMTTRHQYYLISQYPESKGKIFGIKEFSKLKDDEEKLYIQFEKKKQDFYEKNIGSIDDLYKLEEELYSLDISDPFGGDLTIYRTIAEEIEESIIEIIKTLNKK